MSTVVRVRKCGQCGDVYPPATGFPPNSFLCHACVDSSALAAAQHHPPRHVLPPTSNAGAILISDNEITVLTSPPSMIIPTHHAHPHPGTQRPVSPTTGRPIMGTPRTGVSPCGSRRGSRDNGVHVTVISPARRASRQPDPNSLAASHLSPTNFSRSRAPSTDLSALINLDSLMLLSDPLDFGVKTTHQTQNTRVQYIEDTMENMIIPRMMTEVITQGRTYDDDDDEDEIAW